VLAPAEVERLLETLRTLAAEGKTIVIVTHKLDEVRAVADTVTVLREGATVATFDKPLEVATIAHAMVGEDISPSRPLEPPPGSAPTVLSLGMLSVGRALSEISFDVQRGEIVGVAGVDGNGQRELVLAIAGLVKSRGRIRIGDRDAAHDSPGRRLAAGLAHVPEDRHRGGLILDASVSENLALNRKDITGRFQINRDAVRKNAVKRIAEPTSGPPTPMRSCATSPAAISRRSSSVASCRVRTCGSWSPRSRRAVSTSARSRSFTIGCAPRRRQGRASSWCLRISTSCSRSVIASSSCCAGGSSATGGDALRATSARDESGS
jgi:ABC-type branched-subunit amino acid transport system ATPase component